MNHWDDRLPLGRMASLLAHGTIQQQVPSSQNPSSSTRPAAAFPMNRLDQVLEDVSHFSSPIRFHGTPEIVSPSVSIDSFTYESGTAEPSAAVQRSLRTASASPSTTDSRGASSIFSHCHGTRSVRTESTAPLRAPHLLYLVCDFVGLTGCTARFNTNEIDAYMHHIGIEHLQNYFPRDGVCWFCPEEFHAETNSPDHRWECFRNRMEHIAQHVRDRSFGPEGQILQVDDNFDIASHLRPDFWLIDHAHDHSLISEDRFQYAIKYREQPESWPTQEENPPSQRRDNAIIEVAHASRPSRRRLQRARDEQTLM